MVVVVKGWWWYRGGWGPGVVVSDREGHGHKAVVYKSHFPPLRHSVVTETAADTLANKPCLQAKTLLFRFLPDHQL